MSKDSSQSTTVRPDKNTSAWIDLWRNKIDSAMGALPNGPDYGAAREGLIKDFVRMRTQAGMTADDYATKAGAFGGDRSAIFKANAVNDVNANEASTLSRFDLASAQDQWQRQLALLGMMGGAANVGGQTTTQQMSGSPLGGLIGLGTTIAGIPGIGSLFGGGIPAAPDSSFLPGANRNLPSIPGW